MSQKTAPLQTIPPPAAHPPSSVLRRRLAYIILFRLLLYTLLLGGTVAVHFAWGTPEDLGGAYVTVLFVFIAAVYILNIAYALLLRVDHRLHALAAAQVAVDLVTAGALVHFTGGAQSPYMLFFVLSPIPAAMTQGARGALITAILGALILAGLVSGGYHRLIPILPGQSRLPWDIASTALLRGLLVNLGALFAVAALSAYLAEQLRSASDRVEVQAAHIQDLAQLNADTLRCLTSGLVTVDGEGQILTLNQAATDLLGLPEVSGTSKRLGEVAPQLWALLEGSSRPIQRAELTLRLLPSRPPRILGISTSALTDRANRQTGWIINFQDLTTVRQMEQTIRRSEHLATLGRIAAGIAHEIRNPLASISGSLELLRADIEKETDGYRLTTIALREIERLDALIRDLLDYARPVTLRLAPVDLGREVATIVERIRPLLEGDRGPLPELLGSSPALWVRADTPQLQGVLWNLVRNARQAGQASSIRLRVHAVDDYAAALVVEDNGVGIPPDNLPQIFEPFFTTAAQGNGLGLAMVQRVIRDHQATIEVESNPGSYTRFTLRFPRIAPPKEAQEEHRPYNVQE